MAANMNKLAKMMANLTHIFGWIEKLSRIFQRKWKMRLSLFIGGTYVPASIFRGSTSRLSFSYKNDLTLLIASRPNWRTATVAVVTLTSGITYLVQSPSS